MASSSTASPPTTSASTTAIPTHIRRARIAVAMLFLTNGALFANLLPRYPAIKDSLFLSNTEFGLAVACFPLGALMAGLTAGNLIRRFGSARTAVVGTTLTGVWVLMAGVSPVWAALAGSLFLAGSMDAITDVAQNSHGLLVQRLYRRSILNSFHAVWSVGAVLGGLMGGLAAGLEIPVAVHLGASAAIFTMVSVVCLRYLLPKDQVPTDRIVVQDRPQSAGGFTKLARFGVLMALVGIAASGAIVEDAGSTWSAVYLSGSLGAGLTVAGLGFVALTSAQFLGRVFGDRLVDRWGQRLVARAGGVMVVVGMGSALAFPSVPGIIAGFAAAGFGVATLVPAAMHAADELPGLKPGTGLTVVSWLMRVGFLLSPPLVGLVADATTLRIGLFVVPLAGIVVVVLAQVLSRGSRNRRRN